MSSYLLLGGVKMRSMKGGSSRQQRSLPRAVPVPVHVVGATMEKQNVPCHCTVAAESSGGGSAVPLSSCHGTCRQRHSRRGSLFRFVSVASVLILSGTASAFTSFHAPLLVSTCSNNRIRIRRSSSDRSSGGRVQILPTRSSAAAPLVATGSSTADLSADDSSAAAAATTTAAASAAVDPSNLPSIVNHILHHTRNLDDLYDRSSTIRCPFLRRRAADVIDGIAMILRFLVIRHKSLGIFDPLKTLLLLDPDESSSSSTNPGTTRAPTDAAVTAAATTSSKGAYYTIGGAEQLLQSTVKPPGWKAIGKHVKKNADGTICKNRNLPLPLIASTIHSDWMCGPNGTKGYYLTGRLNSTIYTDDCLFDGPDPDMPVRGLRKYLSAASHLFERESSHAQLLDVQMHHGGGRRGNGVVVVRWRLGGTLMLPWRPTVKPWTGTTRYHLDEEGLIYMHEEEWDITVLEAFVCTVFPEVGRWIWGGGGPPADADAARQRL